MRKKIILGVLLVILVVAFAGYKMIYKEHRDIATEEAEFTLSADALQKEFTANDSLANVKYADKTILVSGKATAFDAASNTVTVDEILSATLKDKTEPITIQSPITIKGRFVGYDDLLGELKMDQVSLIKK